jgi:hypothetical protein
VLYPPELRGRTCFEALSQRAVDCPCATVPEIVPITRQRPLEALGGVAQVAFGDNRVAIENAARAVAGKLHCHAFGDAVADEVADGAAAKVVRDLLRQARQQLDE